VDFPETFFFEGIDETEAAEELALRVDALGLERLLILSSVHGHGLATALRPVGVATPPQQANQRFAANLGSRAKRAGADALVAIGGGRCLDIAKLAAARAGVTIVAVPTQLSHDGICSPVAVVPNHSGRTESLGAIAPRFVFVSLATLLKSPVDSVAAGIGDLLANPLALRDWSLAAERGLADIDQRAWDLSVQSFQLIESALDTDARVSAKDPAFFRRLADALILSGLAMICAGTSRPASGGEHEISHAIDEVFGGRAMHGAQVAFGCIISAALYGQDTDAFRGRLRRLGLPQHPADIGLSEDDVVKILLAAPDTRPGRFTIVEDADLDETKARALVDRIWSND
jgi:glycerol-1-phosphate dehydrogenase [NAD(P)+]